MIEFKHVSKVYENGTHALNDVSINIDDGEFVFVVGASGAGKSTFLKLLMREEVPTSGSIFVKKHNLGEMPPKEIPFFRRKMGIVFQDFRLIPTMSVYDNVAFAMRVVGTRENHIRKRVPYVLNLVGLASKARCYPSELSGGEQQRVALARALANNADLIVADEPTGNVDPQMSLEIIELLSRLNDGGTTVIMVTHEHGLVRQFNRRVIILEGGRVVHDGSSSDSDEMIRSSQGHLDKAYVDTFDPNYAVGNSAAEHDAPETAADTAERYGFKDADLNLNEALNKLTVPNLLTSDSEIDFTVYLSDDSPSGAPDNARTKRRQREDNAK